MSMDPRRVLRHLFTTVVERARAFPACFARGDRTRDPKQRIHASGSDSALRSSMRSIWPQLMAGMSARDRSIEVFSHLRVWDTEHNNGVLIYLLLADRDVEIVADRGIHARVGAGWEEICARMEQCFRKGQFEAGVLEGIRAVGDQLVRHFPSDGQGPNELSDKAVVL